MFCHFSVRFGFYFGQAGTNIDAIASALLNMLSLCGMTLTV